MIVFKTIDERVENGVYTSVLVEIHFTLTKVEDNRIKEILVNVVDVGKVDENNDKEKPSENSNKNSDKNHKKNK